MGWKGTDREASRQRTKQAAAPLGCLGGLLQLLEFHRRLRCPYASRHATTPPSSPITDRTLPPVRLVVSSRAAEDYGVAEGGRAESQTPNTPSVVARLMGLNSFPTNVSRSSSSPAVRRCHSAPSPTATLRRSRSSRVETTLTASAIPGSLGSVQHNPPSPRRPVLHPKPTDAANSSSSAAFDDCSSWPLGCSWSLPETPRSSSARRSSFDGVEGRLSLQLYRTNTEGKENTRVEFDRICEVVSETKSSSLLLSPASALHSQSRRRKARRQVSPAPLVMEPPHPTRDGGSSLHRLNITVPVRECQDKKENKAKQSNSTGTRIAPVRSKTDTKHGQESKPTRRDNVHNPAVRAMPPPSFSMKNYTPPPLPHPSQLLHHSNSNNSTSRRGERIKTPPPHVDQRISHQPSTVAKHVLEDPKPLTTSAPIPTADVHPSHSPARQITEKQQSRPVSPPSSTLTQVKAPSREYVKRVTYVKEQGAANRKLCASTPLPPSWDCLEEWHYVKTILREAGVHHGANNSKAIVKWHSSAHPIDPILFHKLELSKIDDYDNTQRHIHPLLTTGTMRHRCNRKLLYHLVDEILIDLLNPTKRCIPTRYGYFSVVNGGTLLKQIWGKVQASTFSKCHLEQSIKEHVCKDIGNNLCSNPCVVDEVENIVINMERSIISSLINELL